MKILFLTQVLPYPLDAGPKVRAYYVLRWLAEQGHEITLISFVRDDDKPEYVAHLQNFCDGVYTVPMRRSKIKDILFLGWSLVAGRSFIISRDTNKAMRTLVDRLLANNKFEAIHADQLWMAQYAMNYTGIRRILDQHNAVYLIPQRLAAGERDHLKRFFLRRESRSLARYEADMCRHFDQVVTVTEEDRTVLKELGKKNAPPVGEEYRDSHLSVIPICIDPEDKPLVKRRQNPDRVMILGTMFWPPNAEGAQWFAQEIWPLVLNEIFSAKLTIIGKNPPEFLRKLAGSPGSGVEVLGYVENPMPYLEESAVFAVPLHSGGGMRVKIPDAWCWGIPIVSTSIGAEGIEIRHGENILIADDAQSFAGAVINVMKDTALSDRLRAEGRKWVENKYNWRVVYHKWDRVYRNLYD